MIEALCKWGLGRGYHVYASGVGRRLKRKDPGRIDGEWLYDVTCLEYYDDYIERVPLVAESEWSNEPHVFDDFEKLLLCRADLRLMIYNREELKFKWFVKCIERAPRTVGDVYLLAAYCEEEGRFAYRRAIVEGGEQVHLSKVH